MAVEPLHINDSKSNADVRDRRLLTNPISGLEISQGHVPGFSNIHKFGNAPDFDTADGFVTLWDGAEDAHTWQLMQYVYSTTADIDSISSNDAGDAVEITIEGLDSTYAMVTQTVTLSGQTRVALGTPLIRVYRAYNSDSTSFDGHVFVYVNGAITAGVPDTNADIRAIIHDENQQTEMALYTIPLGMTGYMRSWYATPAGGKFDSAHTVRLFTTVFGGVKRLQHKVNLSVAGTSYIQHVFEEPLVLTEKTDIEIDGDTDETGVGLAGGFDIVLIEN